MGLLSLVCCVLAVSGALAQSIPGGWGETRPVDQRTLQVVYSVRYEIMSRLYSMNIIPTDFRPILYRGRVAAGSGYLVKIHIGFGRFIHANLFDHLNGPVEILDIEVGKTYYDPLE
ncbi:uncharacterized protein LOC128182691 isoform X1 [Crassostrea angulata]|uniref:uncharacterized protein LOC128182691 isoform X1 n=1 Tax=Magallana angulata TaxID=2784310 RepID=UPI0022B1A9A2|nr:uncharacterized protein LOC128182691 isoform X1 [Crassostrea angulata]